MPIPFYVSSRGWQSLTQLNGANETLQPLPLIHSAISVAARKPESDGPWELIRKTRRGSTERLGTHSAPFAYCFFSLWTQLSTFRALVTLLLLPDLRRGAPVTDDNQQQDLPRVHPPQSSPPQRAEVDFQRSPVSSLAHGTCVIPDRSLSWGF